MNEKKTAMDRARLAKQKAIELYGDLECVKGIGISRIDGAYAVRINLRTAPKSDDGSNFRTEIDGVPVTLKIVGKVHSLTEPKNNEESPR